MITRQFRPILAPPLRLSFRPNSSTASSLTDDLCQSVLIYRSPLRKLDTSSNQLRASLDKVCASGKLLSFKLAGTGTGCGQSTAGRGGLTAHPVKVARQVTSASQCGIAHLPRFNQALCIGSLLLTILACKSSKDHSKPRNEVDTSLKSPV